MNVEEFGEIDNSVIFVNIEIEDKKNVYGYIVKTPYNIDVKNQCVKIVIATNGINIGSIPFKIITYLKSMSYNEDIIYVYEKKLYCEKQYNIYLKRVNNSYRFRGEGARINIVPRWVVDNVDHNSSLLDFGAGPHNQHANILEKEGFKNITCYDIGKNYNEELHDAHALSREYDVVYLSNVINVQPTLENVDYVLAQASECVKEDGQMILNFPNPHYCKDLTESVLYNKLNILFDIVLIESVNEKSRSTIYVCKLPKQN